MTGTRRRPRQARSRERVDRLLNAAGRILADEGYAALTTNRIAAEAEVPVGSLYQYFADKAGLVSALALRSLERLDAELDRALPGEDDFDWEQVVDGVLDALAALYRDEPGFRAVWLGPNVSPELVAADREHDDELVARLTPLLRRALPGLPARRLKLVGQLIVQVAGSVLALATRLGGRRGAAALTEGKTLIKSYLREAGASPRR